MFVGSQSRRESKKYFFTQDSLNEIESVLNDSKQFWDKWKNFGDLLETNKSNIEIPGKKLYEHYSKLHKKHDEDKEIEPDATPVKILDNEKLNRPFSKNEFKAVIDDLKRNKSEGYDGISNDMIKDTPG